MILALIIVKKYGLVEFVYFFGFLYDKILNINILEMYSQQFAIFFMQMTSVIFLPSLYLGYIPLTVNKMPGLVKIGYSLED